MPATETVIERIAVEIVRRLEAITVDGGYSFNVAGVVRPDRLGREVNPKDRLIVVYQGESQYNEAQSRPGNPPAIAYDTTFSIVCFSRESDRLNTEVASSTNEILAAARKAIVTEATSPSVWYTMASNAIICNWGSVSPFSAGDTAHAGGIIPLIVTHRESENDPYVARS
jgi:hypothetical protein